MHEPDNYINYLCESASGFQDADKHPLDRKQQSPFGLVKEDNYYQRIHSHLSDIMMHEQSIGEKDFNRSQEVFDKVDGILRTESAMKIANHFNANKYRPQYCAEAIYSKLK
jgi:hypothetical protein